MALGSYSYALCFTGSQGLPTTSFTTGLTLDPAGGTAPRLPQARARYDSMSPIIRYCFRCHWISAPLPAQRARIAMDVAVGLMYSAS